MAKAKGAESSTVVSGVREGKRATGIETRLIVPYGAPGTRKTTGAGKIKGAKWIITDPNCVATLSAEDLLPPDRDTYEVDDLSEAQQLVYDFTDAAAGGKFKVPAVVIDSMTAISDFTTQDVARAHGANYLGEKKEDNGWQDFNARFGKFIDSLSDLAHHVNVIAICHGREKADSKRGDWQGLNLGPQMAHRLGRTANWILYHTIRSEPAPDDAKDDDLRQVLDTPDGRIMVTCQVHTLPVGLWNVKCSGRKLDVVEPADYGHILRKEGLIK